MTDSPILVVGGGLFGLATALHLARAGREVTVLESGTVAGATTAAGAGFVGLWAAGYVWYWDRNELDLEQYGIDFYRALDADGHNIGFRATGNAWLAVTDQGSADHIVPFAEDALRPEDSSAFGPADAPRLIPGLDPRSFVDGFLHAGGIQISAPDAGLALAEAARAAGVTIVEGVTVTEVLTSEGRAVGVRTDEGSEVLADTVVLATGSWTNALLAPFGRRLPFVRVIASRLTTAPFGLGPIPTIMIPELGGLWIREHRGGLTFGNAVGYEQIAVRGLADDRRPSQPELLEAMREHLVPIVSRLFPDSVEALSALEATQGIVSYTADRRFIVGAIPEVDGLWVAAGDNESGVTHGPGLGRLAAELITGSTTTIADPALYAPARFTPLQYPTEQLAAQAMPPRRAVDRDSAS